MKNSHYCGHYACNSNACDLSSNTCSSHEVSEPLEVQRVNNITFLFTINTHDSTFFFFASVARHIKLLLQNKTCPNIAMFHRNESGTLL